MMGFRIVFLFILFAMAVGLKAAALVRGPYLQSASSTGMVIRWRTDVATGTQVRYGTQGGNLDRSAAFPGTRTEHVVTIGGLSPHTQYFYSVGSELSVWASGSDYFFVTSPTDEHATRVWVIGDSGTANANARAVRDAFLNFSGGRPPDLWLMLGDNAYYNGTDAEYQAAMFNMYPMLLRNTPVWSTFGNHEGFSANSLSQTGPYFDLFTFPTNAQAGGTPSGTEAYFSFDHGDIHFICLESTFMSRATNSAMLSWLRADLATANKRWMIAYFHHAPYSKSHHDSDAEADLAEIRATILPVLENGGVDLVLTGHSHVYERSFLLNGHYGYSSSLDPSMIFNGGNGREDGDGPFLKASPGKAPNQGTVYAVIGSSGQTSGGSLDHPVMVTSQIELGSVVLDFETNRLSARFLNRSGQVRDHFTLLKGVTPPPRPTAPGNLVLTFSNSTTVRLLWSDTSSSEQRFLIQRSTDGSNFVEIARLPANSTNYTDTNLYASTLYFYRVRAANQGGDSPNSDVAMISTPGLPFASTGTSSAVKPYLLPAIPPAGTRSVYTSVKSPPDTRDFVSRRRLVGAPAGLGIMDNGNGTLNLLVTHRLDSTQGSFRRHGAPGAFISRLTVRGDGLTVVSLGDLITNVFLWSAPSNQFLRGTNVIFNRFSLGDLPRERAFHHSGKNLGTRDRIFLAGEEIGEGRAFAHLANGPHFGTSVQLPDLGRMSFRQISACQYMQTRTVVALLDRSGYLYFYLGNKAANVETTAVGHVSAAGLTRGTLHGLSISNVSAEANYLEAKGEKVSFRLVAMGPQTNQTGSGLASVAAANGTTLFVAPGGGSWDPNEGDAFYFSTAGGIQGTNRVPGRVWKLKFSNIAQPELGGTVQMVLEGKEGVYQPGSVMIDEASSMLIAETPENDPRLARLFLYDLSNTKGFTNQLQVLGIFDPARFGSNGLTQSEQIMGMADLAPFLGPNQYVLAAAAPYSIADPELVEGGQILSLHYLGVPFPIVETLRIGTNISVTWNSTPYATYAVQGKITILQAGWLDLTNIVASAFQTSVILPANSREQYFRVRRIR